MNRNDILLELVKRLQADSALRVDLSDLVAELESIELTENIGDEE